MFRHLGITLKILRSTSDGSIDRLYSDCLATFQFRNFSFLFCHRQAKRQKHKKLSLPVVASRSCTRPLTLNVDHKMSTGKNTQRNKMFEGKLHTELFRNLDLSRSIFRRLNSEGRDGLAVWELWQVLKLVLKSE